MGLCILCIDMLRKCHWIECLGPSRIRLSFI